VAEADVRRIAVITVHPAFVDSYGRFGVVRAARERGLAQVDAVALRDYAVDKHGSVDDTPYGGGDGMVMRPEPLRDAVMKLGARAVAESSGADDPLVILTTPAGKPWTHAEAARLAASARPLIFVCGRFAGVDQRFVDRYVHAQYSCGDVVLSGGELPALMMIDSVLRLVPGVLGHADSARLDSFAEGFDGQLEHPLYTRPPEFEGLKVPDVLLSGDHAAIERWRRDEARRRTAELRPDLIDRKRG
jgi:tRNA (guanine37-N1)-methyltransferase